MSWGIWTSRQVKEIRAVTAKLAASQKALRAVLATLPKSSTNLAAASPPGKETTMSTSQTPLDAAIAALQAQATENVSVEGSAATLINGFANMITDAANDPPKILAIAAQMKASADALAAAVAANTPAAPPAATT